jgi:hypothetical protein
MMNLMRTIGSRKISETYDSDAYALQRTAAVGGTSTLGRKLSNSGDTHVADRILAHWVSPALRVTRWSPLTVGYIFPPTCIALSSAIMSISTHAPNGTCATLTALRA